MEKKPRSITTTFLAGIVTLLPVGGLILSVVLAEGAIADSWLAKQDFYFPGLGILAVLAVTYLIGLFVTTFVGRWIWRQVDELFEGLPAIGGVYRTLKQVLGYGEGEDALFERVVLVPGRDQDSQEIGLVTRTMPANEETPERLVVFVPAAPTPTSGRLVMIDSARAESMPMSVHDALKFLVAVGKVESSDSTQLRAAAVSTGDSALRR